MTLTERLRAATGPDRELDAEITVSLRIPHPSASWPLNFPNWEIDTTDKGRVWAIGNGNGNGSHRSGSWISQPYTASLDAAISLVPEGWGFSIELERPSCQAMASVSPPGTDPWGTGSWYAAAATPAIALLLAICQARGIE